MRIIQSGPSYFQQILVYIYELFYKTVIFELFEVSLTENNEENKISAITGSAHIRPSAWPPIDKNCLKVFPINFLAKSENSKHFSFLFF